MDVSLKETIFAFETGSFGGMCNLREVGRLHQSYKFRKLSSARPRIANGRRGALVGGLHLNFFTYNDMPDSSSHVLSPSAHSSLVESSIGCSPA
jgi:hypothetical protein